MYSLTIFNDNRFTANFKEKSEVLTAFFAKQSSNVEL